MTKNAEHPKVSLLIAMRNEAVHIRECIDSIVAQDYPSERMEVLIMDGNSSDESWQIVERAIRGRDNFKLLANPGVIQSAGWNLGIAESVGDIVGIVSAHSFLAPDYVSKAVETLERTKADMVGGRMNAVGSSLVPQAISLATSSPFGVGGARFHYTDREEEVDTVYMGLCWRSLYARVGGFDPEMVRNQDDELSYRLRKQGGRIVCNPSIQSYYYNRSSLSSLWKQYYQYGLYKVRVLQKHPLQMRPRQFVPPALALALAASALCMTFPALRSLSVIIPIAYILANLLASLFGAITHGWRYFPLLPLVFALLHIGYGTGFLAGLIKFRSRWGDKVGKSPLLPLPPEQA